MEKLIAITLAMVIFCSACSSNGLDRWNWIESDVKPIESYVGLSVYERDGIYSVVIFEEGRIEKGADFSSEGKMLEAIGVEPVTIDSVKSFLGMTLDLAEDILGEYHVVIDSGMFHPAYITSECHIFYFMLDKEIIMGCNRIDLISGKSVEYYQCWDSSLKGYVDLENQNS